MLIKISITEIFLFLEIGNIKNARNKAKPKWIALAGKPLNIPILNIKGNGDAYQSWNKDQIIAIVETIFKWKPVIFLVGDKSSLILFFILLLIESLIKIIHTIKKRPGKNYQAFLINKNWITSIQLLYSILLLLDVMEQINHL